MKYNKDLIDNYEPNGPKACKCGSKNFREEPPNIKARDPLGGEVVKVYCQNCNKLVFTKYV